MKQQIENIIINKYYVIHIHRKTDKTIFFVSYFIVNKNSLKAIKNQTLLSLEDVLTQIEKDVPILLTFTGEGVIHKKFPKGEDNLLKITDNNNFYITRYESNNHIFASITRRTSIESIIDKILNQGFYVIGFYVGVFSTSILINYISETIDKLYVNDVELQFENLKLINYKEGVTHNKYKLNIENENIDSDFLISLSIIILYFNHPDETITPIYLLPEHKDNLFYKLLSKKTAYVFVFGLFFTLIISFFTLNYYTENNKKLIAEIEYNNLSYKNINKLEKNIMLKEKVLSKAGINLQYYYSYYIGALTKNLPNSITFKSIEINPILNNTNETKTIRYNTKVMLITGNISSIQDFTKWIEYLKKNNGFKKIEIEKLVEKNKQSIFFKLHIFLK